VIKRIALLLAIVAAPLSAQLPKGYHVTPDVSMRIWVPTGKVRVDTWDRDSIRVTGKLGRNSHYFGGGSGRGAKLGIEADNPKDTAMPSGDIVVTVPRKAHVWIKMTDGDITVTNTAGELEVYAVTGSVMVQDAAGVTSVEAIDASVVLAGVNGDVRVRGGGGKVQLSDIHGTLSASTVSGNVEMSGKGFQDSQVETINGAIVIRGTVMPDALLDLETHSGPITLVLDRAVLPALALSSRAGVIKNPLGISKGSNGQITARSFKGNINVVVASGIEAKKPGTPP
jgi:DUF4097 and DUF4098 domain-containing protein YvlB